MTIDNNLLIIIILVGVYFGLDLIYRIYYKLNFELNEGKLFSVQSGRKICIGNVSGLHKVILLWHDPLTNLLLSPADPRNQPDFTLSILSDKSLKKSNKDFSYSDAKRLIKFLKKNYPNIEVEKIKS